MAKTIEAYAYYGVLGHEYTALIKGVEVEGIYDTIEIEIPDDWETGENVYGDILIKAPGCGDYWIIEELLHIYRDNNLWAEWYDTKHKKHREKLEWRKV